MGVRRLTMLLLAVTVCAGCAMSQGMPDGFYINNPSLPSLSNLPDPNWVGAEPTPNAYGHPFRPVALLLNPVGLALDYALMRPLYMLGSLAPQWFGFTVDDSQSFHMTVGDPMNASTAPHIMAE